MTMDKIELADKELIIIESALLCGTLCKGSRWLLTGKIWKSLKIIKQIRFSFENRSCMIDNCDRSAFICCKWCKTSLCINPIFSIDYHIEYWWRIIYWDIAISFIINEILVSIVSKKKTLKCYHIMRDKWVFQYSVYIMGRMDLE